MLNCFRSVCALAVVLACLTSATAHAAEQMFFQLDPLQSILYGEVTLELPKLGIIQVTSGQGDLGFGIPGTTNGTSGPLAGTVAAKVDQIANTVVFGGGTLFGAPTGLWEPGPNGLDGVAPGFLGIALTEFGGLPAEAVAVVRDFWADYTNAYSVTNLNPNGAGGYSFTTGEWFAVSGNVDAQGRSGLATSLESGRFTLNQRFAAENSGQTGSLQEIAPGNWQLDIPFDTNVSIDAGELGNLGTLYVGLRLHGQLVGHSVSIAPDNSIVAAAAGNNTLAGAQLLDGLFNRNYNPDIGSQVLNTSSVIPHASVAATGDGNFDFYSFHVTQPNSLGIFDIDHASFDSQLFLFDAAGHVLASNDDSPSPFGAGGSNHSNDAYLEYSFDAPGLYTIGVGKYSSQAKLGGLVGDAPPVGATYALNVSLTHAVPEPAAGALAFSGALGAIVFAVGRRRRGLFTALVLLGAVSIAAPAGATSLTIKQSIEGVYDADGTYPMPYRFFVPPASDTAAPDAKFPLVLFLHGAGERGTDNWWPSADHIDGLIDATQSNQFASFLLVPQATDFPYADGWDAESPFDRTMEILDQMMTQYPIDPARIYITGLSMGGYGTFNYLQHYPDFFAAAVPMSGGGNPSQAYLYKDVPLWDFHGRLDKTVSVNQSRNMIAALKAAGGSPIYTELLNGDHGIWDPIYNDFSLHQYGLYEWMFDQVNPNVANIAVFVPEPSTVGMALFGALALGCVGHRNRRCRKSVPGKCREHC